MKPLDTCFILQPVFTLFSKENVKYAVRLRNYGSRTANGDGGMTTVQCPDGVTFTFSTCSLSSNGTNQTRGQIPQILYYRLVCCNNSFLRKVNKTITVLLYHICFQEVIEINGSRVCLWCLSQFCFRFSDFFDLTNNVMVDFLQGPLFTTLKL